MANSRVFHLNKYFILANLVQTYGRKLEGCFRLRDDESLGFNICEGHVDICVML